MGGRLAVWELVFHLKYLIKIILRPALKSLRMYIIKGVYN